MPSPNWHVKSTDRGHEPSPLATEWWTLFSDVPAPRPSRATVLTVVAVVVVVIVAVALGLAATSTDESNAPTNSEPAPHLKPVATTPEGLDPLSGLLPPGYTAASCRYSSASDGVTAMLECGHSVDPRGPTAATFTWLRDGATLQAVFEGMLRQMRVTTCPGNIESPGPWHSNATPQITAGMLVCGFKPDASPTVTWTQEADLLIGSVQADPPTSSLDEIFSWWSRQ